MTLIPNICVNTVSVRDLIKRFKHYQSETSQFSYMYNSRLPPNDQPYALIYTNREQYKKNIIHLCISYSLKHIGPREYVRSLVYQKIPRSRDKRDNSRGKAGARSLRSMITKKPFTQANLISHRPLVSMTILCS